MVAEVCCVCMRPLTPDCVTMCVCVWVQLFMRSLPEDCYINIVGFGSRYNKLWPASTRYTQSSLNQVQAHLSRKTCVQHGGNMCVCACWVRECACIA